MHVFISPRSGARGFKHLPFLNDAIEWESRFTLGRNVSKSTDYIENYFNQKSSKIKFLTGWAHMLIFPSNEAMGLQGFAIFKI